VLAGGAGGAAAEDQFGPVRLSWGQRRLRECATLDLQNRTVEPAKLG
jgi:hypothetical protein